MTVEIDSTLDEKIPISLPSKKVKKPGIELFKFGAVGILNTLLDAALYFSLTRWVGLAAAGAKALSYSAGMLNSFYLNRCFTFQTQVSTSRQALLFIPLNLGVLGINTGMMIFGLKILQLPELLALGFATGTSFLVNFWFSKHVVFRC